MEPWTQGFHIKGADISGLSDFRNKLVCAEEYQVMKLFLTYSRLLFVCDTKDTDL